MGEICFCIVFREFVHFILFFGFFFNGGEWGGGGGGGIL